MQEIQVPLTDEPAEKKMQFVEDVFLSKEVKHPKILFEKGGLGSKRQKDADMTLERHLQGISPKTFLKVHTGYVDHGAGQVFQLYGEKGAEEIFGLRMGVEGVWRPVLIRIASVNDSPGKVSDLFAWYIAPHTDENYAALNGIFKRIFECGLSQYKGAFVRDVR